MSLSSNHRTIDPLSKFFSRRISPFHFSENLLPPSTLSIHSYISYHSHHPIESKPSIQWSIDPFSHNLQRFVQYRAAFFFQINNLRPILIETVFFSRVILQVASYTIYHARCARTILRASITAFMPAMDVLVSSRDLWEGAGSMPAKAKEVDLVSWTRLIGTNAGLADWPNAWKLEWIGMVSAFFSIFDLPWKILGFFSNDNDFSHKFALLLKNSMGYLMFIG